MTDEATAPEAPAEAPADTMTAAQAAEFDALAAELGPEDLAAAGGEPAPGAQSAAVQAAALDWNIAAAGIVGVFAALADNWALTAAEQAELRKHLATTLAAFFPDLNMDPRWQAAGALALTLGGIAFTRVDPVTRKLKPLRKPAAIAAANVPTF